jgi:hypothetical protein
MENNIQTISGTELRKNMATGLAVGATLGVVFGSSFGSLWLGGIVGIALGLLLGFRLRRFSPKMRYPMFMIRRMLLGGSLAMLTAFAYTFLLDRGLSRTQLILAALVPIAGIAVCIISLATAIASLDELQRRIQTEAIAIGFAGTAIFCLGYALLGLAGVPSLNWGWVVLVMVVMWLVGKILTMWRYR